MRQTFFIQATRMARWIVSCCLLGVRASVNPTCWNCAGWVEHLSRVHDTSRARLWMLVSACVRWLVHLCRPCHPLSTVAIQAPIPSHDAQFSRMRSTKGKSANLKAGRDTRKPAVVIRTLARIARTRFLIKNVQSEPSSPRGVLPERPLGGKNPFPELAPGKTSVRGHVLDAAPSRS